MLAGYLGDPKCFGIKRVSLYPGNAALGISSYWGLYEAACGQILAMMDARVYLYVCHKMLDQASLFIFA